MTPKKKNRHMFKGELWLDEETGMPLRETGQFVKNASFVIKSIRFVREYKIRAGVTPQDRITSTPDRITSTIADARCGPRGIPGSIRRDISSITRSEGKRAYENS